MIQMLFSIKFHSQLRRIRPQLFEKLEKTIISSVQVSGGVTRSAFHCIIADFDENAMGFWIDVLSCIEAVDSAIRKASGELYGYCCVISKIDDDDHIPLVLRSIPSDGKASGIWCSKTVQKALTYFAAFSANMREVDINNETELFTELEAIRNAKNIAPDELLYSKVRAAINADISKRTLVLGPQYTGKRESLRRFCAERADFCPPLTIRFGAAGNGLCCLADSWTEKLQTFFNEQKISISEEAAALKTPLLRERLREESSKYTLQKAKRFFHLLLGSYCEAAFAAKKSPVLIFENIQNAQESIVELLVESIKQNRGQFFVYGTCSPGGAGAISAEWKTVFNNIIELNGFEPQKWSSGAVSPSLWEIAYACKLFYKYFPSESFVSLFEAHGKNGESVRRTLELLHQSNIIRSIENPEPEIEGFTEGVQSLLGERCIYIKSIVKEALLSHLASGKIAACYQLLEALHELGGGITDELALEALRSDIINDTYRPIERAISAGSFIDVVGESRAPVLLYCFKALCSLLFAGEIEIRETFRMLSQPESQIKIYKSQIYTIEASYKMGLHDINAALAAIKESMVISQSSSKKPKIAHVYRLFSLVNLSKRELSDALDYLSFAIDDAEKNKDSEELSVSAYYAANAHFIYGNISKAERLIKLAEHTARLAGRLEWALRSQFVLGRYYFEMGNYKSALSVFKAMLESSEEEVPRQFITTLNAWVFRTELYLYECLPEKPASLNADGKLFELEASYLVGDYKKTVELSESFLQNLPEEKFLFLEQPDWESGFSQCELLEFTHGEFWTRMCTVWRSLAMCRLKSGAVEESIHAMSQIMRDERFSDYDPNAPFYFFANYRVLNESSSSEVDRNTAISMAFKRLQRRAGRIDDIVTRRAFLSNQYWNKILFNTAKAY
ncbi:MAG: hypothetical protein LBG79_04920, partial [Spirochaetaceae bacterium]|nr:hypothetical protein [Spirochaetaceae bacterium]